LRVQAPAKLPECLRIQRTNRQSGLRSPSGESRGTAQMRPDLVATVACASELSSEIVQVGTGRTGPQLAKREGVFEVGR
jgi:hypothetical protein